MDPSLIWFDLATSLECECRFGEELGMINLENFFLPRHCHCWCENCLQCRERQREELFVDLRSPIDQQWMRSLLCILQAVQHNLKEIVRQSREMKMKICHCTGICRKKCETLFTQREIGLQKLAAINSLRNARARANYRVTRLLGWKH